MAAEAQSQKRRKQIRNGIIFVVIAGVIVGIVFLVSGNNNNTVASKSNVSSTTTTVAAGKASDAKLQAQANEVAVKAGCPASPKTPTAAASQKYTAAPPKTIDTSKTYTATFKTTTGTFEAIARCHGRPEDRQ